MFDLFEHTIDIGRGEIHACRRSNDVELGRNSRQAPPAGCTSACRTHSAMDTRANAPPAGCRDIRGPEHDLQPLSHTMSVIDSS